MTATAAAALLNALAERRLTVATAESLTGGLVAAAITDIPGASRFFRGGVVAYATDVKASVLGVSGQVLQEHGPVAAQTAAAMAAAAARVMAADVGLATTGVAGPDPVGQQPPGLAYVAAAGADGSVLVDELRLPGGRQQIREACVAAALMLGVELLRLGTALGE